MPYSGQRCRVAAGSRSNHGRVTVGSRANGHDGSLHGHVRFVCCGHVRRSLGGGVEGVTCGSWSRRVTARAAGLVEGQYGGVERLELRVAAQDLGHRPELVKRRNGSKAGETGQREGGLVSPRITPSQELVKAEGSGSTRQKLVKEPGPGQRGNWSKSVVLGHSLSRPRLGAGLLERLRGVRLLPLPSSHSPTHPSSQPHTIPLPPS